MGDRRCRQQATQRRFVEFSGDSDPVAASIDKQCSRKFTVPCRVQGMADSFGGVAAVGVARTADAGGIEDLMQRRLLWLRDDGNDAKCCALAGKPTQHP